MRHYFLNSGKIYVAGLNLSISTILCSANGVKTLIKMGLIATSVYMKKENKSWKVLNVKFKLTKFRKQITPSTRETNRGQRFVCFWILNYAKSIENWARFTA